MSEGIDSQTKKYLVKVLNSMFIGLLWLALNVLGGLYYGYAIVEKKLMYYNVLFYLWFILSLCALLYYYYRRWK